MNQELSNVKKAEIAHKLYQQFKEAQKMERFSCLKQGQILTEFKKVWSQYAPHCHTFEEFIEGELNIGRSTAYHYMNIWKEFGEYVLSNKLDIPVHRLIKLLPVTTQENKKDWLDKAQHLTRKDFEIEIQQAKGKNPEACDPNKCDLKVFYYCPKHHKWYSEHQINGLKKE